MSYETWETVNIAGMVGVLVAPLLLAGIVFLNRRQRHDGNGKRNGRAVLWSFVTAFFSFLAFLMAWGLTIYGPFPEYVARWNEKYDTGSQQTTRSPTSEASVIDGIIGQWRPNNRNRTDYFAFTADTYSSVNPEFNTTLTWNYTVVRRDGPCMRIRQTHVLVLQGQQITRDEPMHGDPFVVCVDPDTDQMLMRFDGDRGDVFFTRMN